MDEIWKPIEVFGIKYEVSNNGRIRNVATGRIYKNTNKKGGYLRRILGHHNKKELRKTFLIHRLVYEMFNGKIPNGFHIHHKDGNCQNNNIDNLVLISPKEHSREHMLLNPQRTIGMNNYNKYIRPNKIEQYDLDGVYIATFRNAKEASDASGVCRRNILQVANGEKYNEKGSVRKQAGGYIWGIAQ